MIPADLDPVRTAATALERYASATEVRPRDELAGRILAALEAEPTPAPLTAMASAARAHRAYGVLTGVLDLWRVTWTGGRPVAIRLSAAIAVLLLVVTAGSAGGLATAAAWNALNPAPVVAPPVRPSPSPVLSPSPTPAVTPTATTTASPTPSPSPRPSPSPSQSPSRSPMPQATPASTTSQTQTPNPTWTDCAGPSGCSDRTPYPDMTYGAEWTHGPSHP